MPVGFWNDPDGSRYRAAYFEDFPGRVAPRRLGHVHRRWLVRHHGPLDATLNRGGVRLGTSDFYAVVEGFDEIADSLVVHLEDDRRR